MRQYFADAQISVNVCFRKDNYRYDQNTKETISTAERLGASKRQAFSALSMHYVPCESILIKNVKIKNMTQSM